MGESGGERLLSWWLGGELGPQEGGELAGDSDGYNGGALALGGEVTVAVKEPDLRLPCPVRRLRAAGGATGCVPVVPGGLDQQPAGVTVAGPGDVPAVLLLAA